MFSGAGSNQGSVVMRLQAAGCTSCYLLMLPCKPDMHFHISLLVLLQLQGCSKAHQSLKLPGYLRYSSLHSSPSCHVCHVCRYLWQHRPGLILHWRLAHRVLGEGVGRYTPEAHRAVDVSLTVALLPGTAAMTERQRGTSEYSLYGVVPYTSIPT